jgi:MFS family permease
LLIVAVGTGPVFLINAASFAATVAALFAIRGPELTPAVKIGRERGQVRAGLAYVRGRSDLMALLSLVGMVGTFGLNFQLTTALMATSVYGKGAGEYGLLGSIMAIGSLGGALLAARRGRPSMRLVVMAAAAFGVCCLVASVMPTYPLFAAALVPTGLASLTFMTSANASVQLATDRQMRGRVMALYMAIFMGGTPAGAPFIGWVGETFGARWTLAVGGLATLLAVGVVVAAPDRRTLAWRYLREVAAHPLASRRRRRAAAQAMAAEEMTLR